MAISINGVPKTNGIADNAVTTAKITDGAVTNAKLQYAYVRINSTDVTLGDPTGITISASPSGTITSGDLTGTYPNPTLAAVGTAGTYTKVTTDSKGRVTSGTTLSASDIPTITSSKISDLGTAATKNIPTTGDASATQVVYGTDSRLTDARDPKTNSVVTASILDGNVTNAKLANASVTINGSTVSLGGSINVSAVPSGSVTGDVTGTLGSTTTLTLANTAVVAGTYPKVTVDSKGRVTAGTTLSSTDIPDISATYATKASPTFTGTITTPLTGSGTRIAQVSSTGVLSAGLGVDNTNNASTIVARDASSNVYASTFYGNLGVTAGGSANVSLGLSGVLTMGAYSTISASNLNINASDVASLSGVGASGTLVNQLAAKVTTPSSWTTYTPVVGNGAALGTSGTLIGSYEQIGKTVKFRITWTLGTGSTPGSAGLTLSLPYAPVGNTVGQCIAVNGGTRYCGEVLLTPAQTAIPLVTPAAAGGPSRTIISSVPFTWGSGDQLIISGMYEVA